jgi:hypothetical protein
MCLIDPCASGGLRPVQIAMKTLVFRLRVGNTLESEVGLSTSRLGLRVGPITSVLGIRMGPVRVLLFRGKLAVEVLFLSLRR